MCKDSTETENELLKYVACDGMYRRDEFRDGPADHVGGGDGKFVKK